MEGEEFDEDFVRRAARLQGITLTAAQIPGVIANLRRTAQLAATINQFPLDAMTDELGPLWRP